MISPKNNCSHRNATPHVPPQRNARSQWAGQAVLITTTIQRDIPLDRKNAAPPARACRVQHHDCVTQECHEQMGKRRTAPSAARHHKEKAKHRPSSKHTDPNANVDAKLVHDDGDELAFSTGQVAVRLCVTGTANEHVDPSLPQCKKTQTGAFNTQEETKNCKLHTSRRCLRTQPRAQVPLFEVKEVSSHFPSAF